MNERSIFNHYLDGKSHSSSKSLLTTSTCRLAWAVGVDIAFRRIESMLLISADMLSLGGREKYDYVCRKTKLKLQLLDEVGYCSFRSTNKQSQILRRKELPCRTIDVPSFRYFSVNDRKYRDISRNNGITYVYAKTKGKGSSGFLTQVFVCKVWRFFDVSVVETKTAVIIFSFVFPISSYATPFFILFEPYL